MTGLDRRRRPEDSLDAPLVDDGPAEDMSDEALARLGAALEPIEPPASLRAALLERIEREPRTSGSPGPDEPAEPGAAGTAGTAGAAGAAGPGAQEGDDDAPPGEVVPLRPRRRRWTAVGLRIAAVVVILGVGIGVGRWTALSSMAPTEHYAHLNQAQDVQRVTDTMPDGHVATLTWSRDMSMTALTLPAAMKESASGRSLQVWLKEGETTTSLGVYDPRDGAGFSFLDVMPKPGQQIVITVEPAGGSAQPTTPPLVTLRVSEDAGRSGAATGSPSPASSAGPTGDSA